MIRRLLLAATLSLGFLATSAVAEIEEGEVTFPAADGATVYADVRLADTEDAPWVVMFHQARANGRGEYAEIAPVLEARGYNLLLVDQRSGGGQFGSENRTVEARGGSAKFCEAYPDAEGALDFAKAQAGGEPVFVWGSSYSSALTLKLATEQGEDLAGALVFSPYSGGRVKDCRTNDFIPQITIPTKAFLPKSEMNRSGRSQRDAFLEAGHGHYVMDRGVHGASMLDPSRAKGDPSATWEEVFEFLGAATGAGT